MNDKHGLLLLSLARARCRFPSDPFRDRSDVVPKGDGPMIGRIFFAHPKSCLVVVLDPPIVNSQKVNEVSPATPLDRTHQSSTRTIRCLTKC